MSGSDYSVLLIGSIHIPLLVLAGTEDQLTPPSMAQALLEKANEPERLYMVP
jgi:fermentation-respiration switch protein FrsA (DUF1100 family)